MEYKGSRLKEFLSGTSGAYTELEKKMGAMRKPRVNASKEGVNLTPLMKDGHNVTVETLTRLMKCTGQPLDFFVDMELEEYPRSLRPEAINGNNNVVNSNINNDLVPTVAHLQEKLQLKDQLLAEKERNIVQKEAEIENLRKINDRLLESLKK